MRHRIVAMFMMAGAINASAARADVLYSAGNVDGRMAVASRADATGQFEIEAADDFVVAAGGATISTARFTGLLTGGATFADVTSVTLEIYRVFPFDSNTVRTPQVPTRVNSPSDVAVTSATSANGGLSFTTTVLASTFTASNSVQPGGIHPTPNQTTGGSGPIAGQEVQFAVNLATPFLLAADHYFFVAQVNTSAGAFYWLSSARPIVAPGTPFAPDLQAWTRDAALDPDWLRIGTDIVGGATPTTFNLAFQLEGTAGIATSVPEPSTLVLAFVGLSAAALARRRRRDQFAAKQ